MSKLVGDPWPSSIAPLTKTVDDVRDTSDTLPSRITSVRKSVGVC